MLRAAPLCTLLLAATASAADFWPHWRGGDFQGRSHDTALPLTWDKSKNVRWRVPLPDAGSSTPIVWGDKVFVTQASNKTGWPPPGGGGPALAETRALLCFARADGKLLWERKVSYKEKEATHPTNPYCSASPATDGERVVVSHGSAGLYCYDLDGKELWQSATGKQEHIWGNASSPILYKNLCYIWIGPGENQVLRALDKKTGTTVWEHKEPGGNSGLGSSKEWRGSWSTPLIMKVGGREEFILTVPEKVRAFDPMTGRELWSCAGLGKLVYTSPICTADGVVVAMSGYHGPSLAVRAGGQGDVTATHRLWHNAGQNPQRIGSGVVVGNHVYILQDDGTAMCLDVQTGKDLWGAKRLGGTWGSMVAAGDRLYVAAKNGDTFVLKASPQFEELARNRIGEQMFSSPAPSGGDLFLRTYKALWCLAEKK